MPVYVYRNLTTGETFEVEQSIREDAWKVHPESGDPVKRIVQPVGIAFKGSGFYVNDSRGKGAKNAASAPTSDSSSSSKADSSASPSASSPSNKSDTSSSSSTTKGSSGSSSSSSN